MDSVDYKLQMTSNPKKIGLNADPNNDRYCIPHIATQMGIFKTTETLDELSFAP